MEVNNLLDIHTREELYAWYLEHHATVPDFWLRVKPGMGVVLRERIKVVFLQPDFKIIGLW